MFLLMRPRSKEASEQNQRIGFNLKAFAQFFIAIFLLLPMFPQSAHAIECHDVFSNRTYRSEQLMKVFGPDRLRGFQKVERRTIERILFNESRDVFLAFWSKLSEVSEKKGRLTPKEAIHLMDGFHRDMYDGHSIKEYSFETVLFLAKLMQRHLAPIMPDDSYHLMFGGSFPNGKAELQRSDIDAWISLSLFNGDLDALSVPFQKADADVKKYLKRTDKVISRDFVHLNQGLPGSPFMDYNPIVVLIYAGRIEIAMYDSVTDQRLIIPVADEH